MPYKIVEQDSKYCVVKSDTGETVKCHATETEAAAHMAALYANVSKSFIRKSEAQRYTLGVVYTPDEVDAHGDFARAEDIEIACWEFNKNLQTGGHLVKFAKRFLSSIVKSARGDTLEVEVSESLLTKGALGIQHSDWSDDNGEIVESYIAPVDMEIGTEKVKKGTWLMGVVWSQKNWEQIQRGELTGLSLGGTAIRVSEAV